jgi:mRNA-degrading endonuclease HigB of HigAB toxin-antitoxin module
MATTKVFSFFACLTTAVSAVGVRVGAALQAAPRENIRLVELWWDKIQKGTLSLPEGITIVPAEPNGYLDKFRVGMNVGGKALEVLVNVGLNRQGKR